MDSNKIKQYIKIKQELIQWNIGIGQKKQKERTFKSK